MQELFEIRDNQVWLKSFLEYAERPLCEIKESEEATLEYLKSRFDRFKTKVDAVISKIDSTVNKGSFLVQIKNFKEDIGRIDALGDFASVYNTLVIYEAQIEEQVAANRVRNLEIKNSLLEEAKVIAQSDNWKKAAEELKSIYQRWQKTGAVDAEKREELENNFKTILDGFYTARDAHYKEREKDADVYKETIDKAAKLVEDTSIENSVKAKQLKSLQKEWKTLPSIPGGLYQKLWKEFSQVQDKFFVEYKKERHQEGIGAKNDLVEKAKSLVDNYTKHSIDDIKKLRQEWRKTFYSEDEESKKIWSDFNYWIEKFVELKRLEKLVNKGDIKPKKDEKEIISEKIKLLKRLIRKEKENLEKMNSNLGTFRINHKSKGFGEVMDAKTQEQERKWKVKKDLIKELEEQL